MGTSRDSVAGFSTTFLLYLGNICVLYEQAKTVSKILRLLWRYSHRRVLRGHCTIHYTLVVYFEQKIERSKISWYCPLKWVRKLNEHIDHCTYSVCILLSASISNWGNTANISSSPFFHVQKLTVQNTVYNKVNILC